MKIYSKNSKRNVKYVPYERVAHVVTKTIPIIQLGSFLHEKIKHACNVNNA